MDISLALGGGGSRGYAHIGVIRRLEAEGFRIRALAGTSAGGIISALYASGRSADDMEALLKDIDQSKLFSLSLSEGPGFLSIVNATKLLDSFFGERTFEELDLPCAVLAVDLEQHREVVLTKGKVVDGVLATTAIPGVFPPKVIGNHELVDGGVLNPVPVSVARSLAPALPVVAVVLSSEMEEPISTIHLPLPVRIPTPIVERLTHLRVAQAFSIFLKSVDIGSHLIAELRLEVEEPEVIIRPEVTTIGLLDRVDVGTVVKLGEKAVDQVLPELIRETSWAKRMGRQLFKPGRTNRRSTGKP